MPRFTSALAAYRGLFMVLFRPPGRVTFCSRQKSNQKRLPHVSALRFAPGPLTPVPLRGHGTKGPPAPRALLGVLPRIPLCDTCTRPH